MGTIAVKVPPKDKPFSNGRKSGARPLCNILICIVLLCVLAFSNLGLAQVTQPDPRPPRQQQTTNPWPWFLGFILLGVACCPAFKNSKRELER